MFKAELQPVQDGGAAAKRLSLHQGLSVADYFIQFCVLATMNV